MGCDISIFVEKWTDVENEYCPRLKTKSQIRHERICDYLEDKPKQPIFKWESIDEWSFQDGYWECHYIYENINYRLFSLLADVRNDGTINPISEPRGIPDDASDSYLFICNAWGRIAHSHSWLLLEEILNIDESLWEDIYALNFINAIKSINGDPSKIRICFFFDS